MPKGITDTRLRNKVLAQTQRYRINFDNKRQRRDYYDYYCGIKGAFGRACTPQERTILALILILWSRKKISARSHPHIAEYKVSLVFRKYPFLAKVKAALKQISRRPDLDAMAHVCKALNMDGGILKRSE